MTWTAIVKNNNSFKTYVFNGPNEYKDAIFLVIFRGVAKENEILCLIKGNQEVLFNNNYINIK